MPKKIELESIIIGQPVRKTIFTANGDLLMSRGRLFYEPQLDAFKEFNITELYIPAEGEEDDDCANHLKYTDTDILDVKDEDVLGLAIHDPSGRLLVQAGKSLNAQQREMVLRLGVFRIFLRRPKDKDLELRAAKLSSRLRELAKDAATTKIGTAMVKHAVKTERIVRDTVKLSTQRLDQLTEIEAQRIIELDKAVRALVEPTRLDTPAHADDIDRVRGARQKFFLRARDIFDTIAHGQSVDGRALDEFIRGVITDLVSDRYHRLHLSAKSEQEFYLASHSLTTMVLAVNMAARLNYALPEVLELAYGALLHDIGMFRVPSIVRDKPGVVSEAERRQLELHPSHGIEMLQKIPLLPVTVPLVIVQENERSDGSGYPRKRKTDKIHPYARIVSVAASYDAMTRDRPWRGAKQPYHAMRELLEEVNKGHLEAEIVKVLLETLSLFPIGSGVRLSDSRMGYVLDASGKDYTRPVVCIGAAPGEHRETVEIVDLVKSEHKDTRIIDVVHDTNGTENLQTSGTGN